MKCSINCVKKEAVNRVCRTVGNVLKRTVMIKRCGDCSKLRRVDRRML